MISRDEIKNRLVDASLKRGAWTETVNTVESLIREAVKAEFKRVIPQKIVALHRTPEMISYTKGWVECIEAIERARGES